MYEMIMYACGANVNKRLVNSCRQYFLLMMLNQFSDDSNTQFEVMVTAEFHK